MTIKTNQTYHVRKATINDAAALAKLHVQTFNETHGNSPGNPTLTLRQWQWEKILNEMPANVCCYLAEWDEELAGFAKGQPYHHPDLPMFSGELNKIYVLKQYHRKGIGRLLVYSVASFLLQHQITSMLLFGDAANLSNGFYERLGAEKIISQSGEFHGGYGWNNLQQLVDNYKQLLD